MLLSHVNNVTGVMEELGNPFAETGTDLYSLETKQIMSERVVEAVRSAEDIGKMQYQKCVVNRISSTATAFNDTIHKNNQTLFLRRNPITTSKFYNLQNDVQLMPSLLMKIMPGSHPWHQME